MTDDHVVDTIKRELAKGKSAGERRGMMAAYSTVYSIDIIRRAAVETDHAGDFAQAMQKRFKSGDADPAEIEPTILLQIPYESAIANDLNHMQLHLDAEHPASPDGNGTLVDESGRVIDGAMFREWRHMHNVRILTDTPKKVCRALGVSDDEPGIITIIPFNLRILLENEEATEIINLADITMPYPIEEALFRCFWKGYDILTKSAQQGPRPTSSEDLPLDQPGWSADYSLPRRNRNWEP